MYTVIYVIVEYVENTHKSQSKADLVFINPSTSLQSGVESLHIHWPRTVFSMQSERQLTAQDGGLGPNT